MTDRAAWIVRFAARADELKARAVRASSRDSDMLRVHAVNAHRRLHEFLGTPAEDIEPEWAIPGRSHRWNLASMAKARRRLEVHATPDRKRAQRDAGFGRADEGPEAVEL